MVLKFVYIKFGDLMNKFDRKNINIIFFFLKLFFLVFIKIILQHNN